MSFLKKLSDISIDDLKNMNYQAKLEELQKHPKTMLKFGIILLSVFLALRIFMGTRAELKQLKQEYATSKQKDTVITEYKESQEKIAKFVNSSKSVLTENEFINAITTLANVSHVKIESMVPAVSKKYENYSATQLQLDARSETFRNLWTFIHLIENSQYALRIDQIQIRLAEADPRASRRRSFQTSSTLHETSPEAMMFQLTISLIEIK